VTHTVILRAKRVGYVSDGPARVEYRPDAKSSETAVVSSNADGLYYVFPSTERDKLASPHYVRRAIVRLTSKVRLARLPRRLCCPGAGAPLDVVKGCCRRRVGREEGEEGQGEEALGSEGCVK
jgi:hypothetical protein